LAETQQTADFKLNPADTSDTLSSIKKAAAISLSPGP